MPHCLTCSVMSHSFSQHGLATARRSKHQDTARRIDADLFVQLKVGQRQLHRFSNLLFLNVHASNIMVGDVRLLICKNKTEVGVKICWN